jgi:hypothetical protein
MAPWLIAPRYETRDLTLKLLYALGTQELLDPGPKSKTLLVFIVLRFRSTVFGARTIVCRLVNRARRRSMWVRPLDVATYVHG